MVCRFNDVSERDMNFLFLEEIVSSPDFAGIFLSKVGKGGATVLEIENSKTDAEFGESDMTVIFSAGGKNMHCLSKIK